MLTGGFVAGHLAAVADARPRASCRRRTRAPSSCRCSCRRAPRSRARARRWCRSRRSCAPIPSVQGTLAIVGFSLIDGGAQSNSAFMVARLKPFADRTDAAMSVQAAIGRVFGAGQAVRTANVFAFNLPPIIGLGTGGGFEYILQDYEGRPPAEMGAAMLGLIVAANQDPRLAAVFSTFNATNPTLFLDLDRDKAQALGLRISRRLHRAAGHAGRLLRQRLQPVRPHLAGEPAGRGRRPPRHRRHLAHPCAQRARGDGAAARRRRRADAHRAADHLPLQQLPRHLDQRRAAAGRVLGRCAGGDGERCPPACCRRATAIEWTGTAYQEKLGGGADRLHPRARGAVRLPVPGGAVRKLGHPDPGAAVGRGGRAGRLRRRCWWRGCRSISMRRSAWSC